MKLLPSSLSRLITNICCLFFLIYVVTVYKSKKRKTRFWNYLYERSLRKMVAPKCVLIYLIGAAFSEQKYADVCRVFDTFSAHIEEADINRGLRDKITRSAQKIGRTDLLNRFVYV